MREEKRAFLVGVFWLLMYTLAALGFLNGLWGLHFWHFYPTWARGVFLGFGVLFLVPVVQDRLFDVVAGVVKQTERIKYVRFLLVVVFALGFFLFFRSAIYLLGDGELYLRELRAIDLRGFDRIDRSPLVFWIVINLQNLGVTSERACQIYSWASGGLYVGIACYAAHLIGRCRISRVIILGLLLTPGYMQLFFGYIETYALLMPVGLAYLLSGLLYLQGRCGWWCPSLFLGALIPLHLVHGFLVPSLIVLVWMRSLNKLRDGIFALCLTGGLACFLLVVSGVMPWTLLHQSGDVPWLGLVATFNQAYSTFSAAHLLDILNQYALVVPVVVVGIVLGLFRIESLVSKFLATAALGLVLFSCVANPMIGAFRDWDVMGIAGLPLLVWMCWQWGQRVWPVGVQKRLGVLVCGLAGIQMVMWVGVNADERRAEARFELALEETVLSPYARSYGWETLGGYYRTRGRLSEALAAYEDAIVADPSHPRHRNSAGNLLRIMGRPNEALVHLEKAVAISPDFAEAYSNLGNALSALGKREDALVAYQKALTLDAGLPETYTNVGIVYHELGQFEKAVTYHQKAIALDSNFAKAYSNLGTSLNRLGHYQEAVTVLNKALEIQPDFAEAEANLGTSLMRMGMAKDAVHHFQRAVRLNSHLMMAHFSLGLAYMDLHEFEDALVAFEKTLTLNPQFVQAYHSSGVAYLQLGKFELVRQFFKKTLELDPSYVHAAGIRSWLKANP